MDRNVICTCPPGYTGDPFRACNEKEVEPPSPCDPNPCGANAVCRDRGHAASCVCLPGYPKGDPYEACRPECVTNSDCIEYGRGRRTYACIQQKCKVSYLFNFVCNVKVNNSNFY